VVAACTGKILVILNYIRGAPDPDPAGYPVDLLNPAWIWIQPDRMFPVGSEVGSGKYWPDSHNYDIKHDRILSFHQMTHDNTELCTKTHELSHFSSIQLMSDTNYHSSTSSVTKPGKQSFQFLPLVVQKQSFFSCCRQ